MSSLSGKNVLLTGGSRGLGQHIAESLAKNGANVAIAARSLEGLNKVAVLLKKYNVQVQTFQVDLLKPDHRVELIEKVLQSFGKIDVLINNAGIETEGLYMELPWQDIRDTIELNLVTPMELTYLVLPHMLKLNNGHIVNIASLAARSGISYAATYCGTKAGIVEWMRGLRLEFEGTGICFSSILPGYVTETGMFARFNFKPSGLIGSCTPEQVVKAVIKAIVKGKKETIVNSTPPKLLIAVSELSPDLSDWLKKKLGVVEYQRRKVLNKGDKPVNFIS